MFDFFKKKPAEEPAKASEVVKPEEPAPSKPEEVAKTELSFTQRLKQGLSKTRNLLGSQLNSLFGGGKIDAETYEELETILLTSDIGVAATQKLLDNLKKRVKRENLEDTSALKTALKAELLAILNPLRSASADQYPCALRDYACRRKWRRQNHHHWQTRQTFPKPRQQRVNCCGRYI